MEVDSSTVQQILDVARQTLEETKIGNRMMWRAGISNMFKEINKVTPATPRMENEDTFSYVLRLVKEIEKEKREGDITRFAILQDARLEGRIPATSGFHERFDESYPSGAAEVMNLLEWMPILDAFNSLALPRNEEPKYHLVQGWNSAEDVFWALKKIEDDYYFKLLAWVRKVKPNAARIAVFSNIPSDPSEWKRSQ